MLIPAIIHVVDRFFSLYRSLYLSLPLFLSWTEIAPFLCASLIHTFQPFCSPTLLHFTPKALSSSPPSGHGSRCLFVNIPERGVSKPRKNKQCTENIVSFTPQITYKRQTRLAPHDDTNSQKTAFAVLAGWPERKQLQEPCKTWVGGCVWCGWLMVVLMREANEAAEGVAPVSLECRHKMTTTPTFT